MKLILSRKGCDSATGRLPSPILPDGQICSLPIPEEESPICYADIALDGEAVERGFGDVGALMAQLSRGKIRGDQGAHLDPDLNAHSRARLPGWRPLFGQAGAAAGHLRKQKVGVGDLFLFYGWFREASFSGGTLRFTQGAPDLHVLFGWLQVGQVYPLWVDDDVPPWASEHPHCTEKVRANNALFAAADSLDLPGLRRELSGGGLFQKFSQKRQLTEAGELRGQWLLPRWFWPENRANDAAPMLSYHGNRERWQPGADGVRLRTVGRGQEFVIDCDGHPDSAAWLVGLFEDMA